MALVRDDIFLKPVQSDVRGEREVSFYETTASSEAIPKYNGCEIISGTSYLRLNNVENDFAYPCTIDIKLGRQTYGPNATAAKMTRAKKKWQYMSKTAAAICGMKVYYPSTDTYLRLEKKYGRSLQLNGMLHALTSFLHNGNVVRVDVIHGLLHQLKERKKWLEKICKYVCYSMSILLVYDGAMGSGSGSGSGKGSGKGVRPVVVFVDFAHTFLKDSKDGMDMKYQTNDCLAGIDHVIECLVLIENLYGGETEGGGDSVASF